MHENFQLSTINCQLFVKGALQTFCQGNRAYPRPLALWTKRPRFLYFLYTFSLSFADALTRLANYVDSDHRLSWLKSSIESTHDFRSVFSQILPIGRILTSYAHAEPLPSHAGGWPVVESLSSTMSMSSNQALLIMLIPQKSLSLETDQRTPDL